MGRAPRQAPRSGMARAALHRPRNLRHRHRRGSARVRRARWACGLRLGVGPRRPARRGRAHAAPRRPELVPVGCGQRDRPVLRHRRGARAQRHPRRRRHAVLDQRLRGARLRARLLRSAGSRPRHRRGGAKRSYRHPRPRARHARVGDAGALPARRRPPVRPGAREVGSEGEGPPAAARPSLELGATASARGPATPDVHVCGRTTAQVVQVALVGDRGGDRGAPDRRGRRRRDEPRTARPRQRRRRRWRIRATAGRRAPQSMPSR